MRFDKRVTIAISNVSTEVYTEISSLNNEHSRLSGKSYPYSMSVLDQVCKQLHLTTSDPNTSLLVPFELRQELWLAIKASADQIACKI